jgi:hypothetical protein
MLPKRKHMNGGEPRVLATHLTATPNALKLSSEIPPNGCACNAPHSKTIPPENCFSIVGCRTLLKYVSIVRGNGPTQQLRRKMISFAKKDGDAKVTLAEDDCSPRTSALATSANHAKNQEIGH